MNRVQIERDKGLTDLYVLLPEEVDDIDQFLNAPDKPLICAKILEELAEGIHPKIAQERLDHASIQITLDTYCHVAPGLQEATAAQFDKLVSPKYNDISEKETVEEHY